MGLLLLNGTAVRDIEFRLSGSSWFPLTSGSLPDVRAGAAKHAPSKALSNNGSSTPGLVLRRKPLQQQSIPAAEVSDLPAPRLA